LVWHTQRHYARKFKRFVAKGNPKRMNLPPNSMALSREFRTADKTDEPEVAFRALIRRAGP